MIHIHNGNTRDPSRFVIASSTFLFPGMIEIEVKDKIEEERKQDRELVLRCLFKLLCRIQNTCKCLFLFIKDMCAGAEAYCNNPFFHCKYTKTIYTDVVDILRI